jgi:hypothetical protein
MTEHRCPVCGYDGLEFPPRDYSICSCCGTEFEFDDRALTHAQLRDEWIANGCPWFYPDEPQRPDWDPYVQLLDAGLIEPNTAIGATNSETGTLVWYGEDLRIRREREPLALPEVTIGELELVGLH